MKRFVSFDLPSRDLDHEFTPRLSSRGKLKFGFTTLFIPQLIRRCYLKKRKEKKKKKKEKYI